MRVYSEIDRKTAMVRAMNRITVILLVIMMALSLCGCGGTGFGSSGETGSTQSAQEKESASEEPVVEDTTIEDPSTTDKGIADNAGADMLLLEVNGETLKVELENNDAAQALRELISGEGLKLDLKEYGGFEKVGPLPKALPASDEQMDTSPGDIVLYQGNQISLFYGDNSWSYTKLGRVNDKDGAQLREILGDGDVQIILKTSN